MIQMIVTDLDNTLLRSDSSISDYTLAVLSGCQAKGIKVAFATARSLQAASKFLDLFMPDVFIGYGGGLVLAGDEIIHRFDIPSDISYQLIRECLGEQEIVSVAAINENVALSNRPSALDSSSSHYRYTDFSMPNNFGYLKISVYAQNPSVVERIAAKYPMCDMLRYTGEDLYRFANREALKWNAVKAVADYYRFDTDRFVAFGDDVNDLEMIKNCGIGVAVENAVDEVKAVAKFICDISDQDGVAKWISDHLLHCL